MRANCLLVVAVGSIGVSRLFFAAVSVGTFGFLPLFLAGITGAGAETSVAEIAAWTTWATAGITWAAAGATAAGTEAGWLF